MWAHKRNGNFSIKTAYIIYMNMSSSAEEASFWKKVWSLDCLPKIKKFVWKIFAEMLHVNYMLKFYNPSIDDCCPLCKNDVETVTHLFFRCPIASLIWFALSLQHLVASASDFDWIEDIFLLWFDNVLRNFPFSMNWPSIGAIVMWCIWKLRCNVVFKNVIINLDRVILDTRRRINTYIAPPLPMKSFRMDIKISI